jgi:S-adenosylmethionine:tRNA ribosyltransferase-isomerase
MRLTDFDFDLPPDRIAQHPARPRDAARLLHVSPTELADRAIRDLPALLRPGDVLVANDTRVIPAQLTARRGEARIGITLDQPRSDGTWLALARNARRLHIGDELRFDDEGKLRATVMERMSDGSVALAFNRHDAEFDQALRNDGALALPPYIARPGGPLPEDSEDYQTIFAAREGAVAAPTAGLHFTPALLDALERRGVRRVTVTLHVGAGTFLPVRSDDIARHHMHGERGEVTSQAAAVINATRAAGGRVVAVGTTSLRLLETAASNEGRVSAFTGDTALFIVPGYRFRAVDLLLTNFHLPRSTLFMLVCALAGTERMHAAYAHAIESGYRFYSYGDACLLERLA